MSSHDEEESESSDYTYNTPQETEEGSTCSNGSDEVEDVTNIYHLGKSYSSGVSFKENVLDFALSTGYNIKQYRWDQLKLGYICGTKECPWWVYCSVNKRKNKWEIKRLIEPHSCTPTGACEMLTNPIIARLFVDKIKEEPDYFKPKKIQALIREQYKGISVTRNQCHEARKKAIRWIKQEYDDQFAHNRRYSEEILRSNPGSIVEVVTTDGAGAEGEDIFGRFYVCFSALKESWKRNCRGLIGVDDTFLRGTTEGMLLVAQGRDADNCIYPIAWAIVEVEDEISWVWFIKKLQADLELKDGRGFIIMSDRQKGLINVVRKELPNAEHRKCVRHIYQNIKSSHGKKMELKPLIWNLAWSYNETQYRKNLEKIKEYDEDVYNDVLKRDPMTWCVAYYKIEGNCCEDMENNSVESFNNTIVGSRERPFMSMLEMIRRLAMVRIHTRSAIANKHKASHTPYVKVTLDELLEDALKSKVYAGSKGKYEVEIGYEYESVDLINRECTCCKWQITGIPCVHVYGVILYIKDDPYEYVADWFLTSHWRDTYENAPNTLRGPESWMRGDIALVCEDTERQRKNAKEKRKKSANDSPSKKKQKKNTSSIEPVSVTDAQAKQTRAMHCSSCGGAGHNKRSCSRRKKETYM